MENPVDNSEPPREIGRHCVTYKIWKRNLKRLLKRFQDETYIQGLRSKLKDLSQLPEQSAKIFISQINGLYNRVR